MKKELFIGELDCSEELIDVFSTGNYSFSGNGKTDSDDYMLVHWRKGYKGRTFIDWAIADEAKIKPIQRSLL